MAERVPVAGVFVTGTDTGVGKTLAAQIFLAAAAAGGRRVAGMKPVASGCRASAIGLRSDDAEALIEYANVAAAYHDVNPCAFEPAIAPHLAARAVGADIELARIQESFSRLAAAADYVVVEGVGGWLTPINERETMADVAAALALPVVLVVGMRLGCINHALLTRAAIAQYGMRFAGWIGNCIDPGMERLDDNLAALARRLGLPLARLSHAAPGPSVVRQHAQSLSIPE